MNRLLDEPDKFYSYSKLYAFSVAGILAWGFRAKDLNSFWYKDVGEMIEKVWLSPYTHIVHIFNVSRNKVARSNRTRSQSPD